MAKKATQPVEVQPVTGLELWMKVFESIGKPREEAERILADLAARFPDLDSFHRAVQAYITSDIVPALAAIPSVLTHQAAAWWHAGGKSVVKRTDSALG